MKAKHFVYLLAIIVIAGCGGQNSSAPEQETSSTDENTGLLTATSAGFLNLGDVKSEIKLEEGLSMRSLKVVVGEGIEDTQWYIDKGQDPLFGFFVRPDDKGREIVWEISVFSPDFKTKEGIGIGSKVSEFKKAYPDMELWYSPYGYWYVAETAQMPNVQFYIDPTAYTGTREQLQQPGEIIRLKESDFNTDGKLMSIRMWSNPEF